MSGDIGIGTILGGGAEKDAIHVAVAPMIAAHGNGVALIFARVDTVWFQREVFGLASGIMFLSGRPIFHHRDGTRAKWNGGAPSVLVAYGASNESALILSGLPGTFVDLRD